VNEVEHGAVISRKLLCGRLAGRTGSSGVKAFLETLLSQLRQLSFVDVEVLARQPETLSLQQLSSLDLGGPEIAEIIAEMIPLRRRTSQGMSLWSWPLSSMNKSTSSPLSLKRAWRLWPYPGCYHAGSAGLA